jgi:hypothetical protein
MDTLERLRHGHLAGAHRLDLSCGLTSFPREIFDLSDTLEVLNLGGNRLHDLPDDLHRLHKLKVLFCGDNAFMHIPLGVGRCPQLNMVSFKDNQICEIAGDALPATLRWLVLTGNELETLPDELGHCRQLQKLMLAGNRLHDLPDTLRQCHRLELIRLSANRLTALPDWLLSLPHLSWLAYAGNPFCEADEAPAMQMDGVRHIDWKALTLAAPLGEGASGEIHEAVWRHDESVSDRVAVKLFKGRMTSDGLPRHEMAACVAAGPHPHLIAVRGVLQAHPQGRAGLVMHRIGKDCQNLAGPPSLASCTRDTYPADLSFDLPMVLRLACAVASATQHLHARGILHGDLYAHNILWSQRGECLLGDFGAASFLPDGSSGSSELRRRLTSVEVRAFGHLLEEVLARCRLPAHPPGMLARLHALQARCTLPEAAARPAMLDISTQLREMAAELDLDL